MMMINNANPDPKPPIFDASILQHEDNIPHQFVWSDDQKPGSDPTPLILLPSIDMKQFLSGDSNAISNATRLVDEACRKHGLFLVVNHGVDPDLIREVHKETDNFFGMPLSEKLKAKRKLGEPFGYSSSFTDRFTSNLPWKESILIPFSPNDDQSSTMVENYFLRTMGEDYIYIGNNIQKYCEAMNVLSLNIMELLSTSLGLHPKYFRKFFEENDSIMRLNYYPPCRKPKLTLGIGPHCDPTSITILHENGPVAGLQVFVDEKWFTISPNPDAFVINIGDTLMALTNGIYKSCVHRAVVNSTTPRKSLVFFVNPRDDRIITPPNDLVCVENPRLYPDFTWSKFLRFTQKHYRVDINTFESFTLWLGKNGDEVVHDQEENSGE